MTLTTNLTSGLTRNLTQDLTGSSGGASTPWYEEGIFASMDFVVDFQNDRSWDGTSEGVVSDWVNNTSGKLSALGLSRLAGDTTLTNFSSYSWYTQNNGTIILGAMYAGSTNNGRILGFASGGQGISRDGAALDRASHFDGSVPTLVAITGDKDWDNAAGSSLAFSWNSTTPQTNNCMDNGTVVTQAEGPGNNSQLYVGCRDNTANIFDGYIHYFGYTSTVLTGDDLKTLSIKP